MESEMIYGSYPELERRTLVAKYCPDDIFRSLLTALALRIGVPISFRELGRTLGIDQKTVMRYVNSLEKSGVVYGLNSFASIVKRREMSKSKKIYFYDTGIRNALISNFNSLNLRNDGDVLWKNLVISRRMEYRQNRNISVNQYYWQTYDGSHIDLVEEKNGKLSGFNIEWGLKNPAEPKKWAEYKNSSYRVINQSNFTEFIKA